VRTAGRLSAEFVGLAALLFIVRFVLRSHLVIHTDEMCHIGAIAVDVLQHGVRFPLLVYAPVDYNNGPFFSGLLTVASFSLLGRSVLALKLVTHLVSTAGALATLWLLRACLGELGVTNRHTRWAAVAALLVAIALAPAQVTAESLSTVGFGSPAEGTPVNAVLLAVFASGRHRRSAVRTAVFWAFAGFALYLSKGTSLVLPVLGAAEAMLAWRSRRHLVAALGGFVLGQSPELPLLMERHGSTSWTAILSIAQRNVRSFPHAFFKSVLFLAGYRIELVCLWLAALVVGAILSARAVGRRYKSVSRNGLSNEIPRICCDTPPITLWMVAAVSFLHIAALLVMAQGGVDGYAVYGYPTLVVLLAILVAVAAESAARRWGRGVGVSVGAISVAMMLVACRPDGLTFDLATIPALWRNQSGAACSWHLAEGFLREHVFGLAPPGQTAEQHAIQRCRSLSEREQVLDCIGGIARELQVRRDGNVDSAPPTELDGDERRAYAFSYGVYRGGNPTRCSDFTSPSLVSDCIAGAELECFLFVDIATRLTSGHRMGRPRCSLPEPPMSGYWAALRSDFLTTQDESGPEIAPWFDAQGLAPCKRFLDACY